MSQISFASVSVPIYNSEMARESFLYISAGRQHFNDVALRHAALHLRLVMSCASIKTEYMQLCITISRSHPSCCAVMVHGLQVAIWFV